MRTEVLRTQNPETIKILEKHVPERVYWIAYIERLAFFALTDFAGWHEDQGVQDIYTAQCSRCSESTSRKHHENLLRLPRRLHLLSLI